MKFLIDEDLSPVVARYLCEELLVDAVAVRDRGLLGKSDRQVLEYAFNTANVGDFERFARATEVHSGIVFIEEGDLLRSEQIDILKEAVSTIERELEAGQDMINRVLYISINGTKRFEVMP
jgi:predicted nuclease of predicted toxin-antitoxin system